MYGTVKFILFFPHLIQNLFFITKYEQFLTLDMARNKGFIPSGPGEISIQRKQLKAIIESLLPACTEPDLETGLPFRAQSIIANPPAYGEFIPKKKKKKYIYIYIYFVT